jgi:hypothetical protein
MIRFAASILLAVELGGGFGAASATIVSEADDSFIVEIEVEVGAPADTVVAHLSLPGEETIIIPLVPRDDGLFGVTTELKQADYVVVFEVVDAGGAQSSPMSLSELGAVLDEELTSDPDTEPGDNPEARRWLWLGVALGAASLSVLAFWVLGGKDKAEIDEEPTHVDAEDSSPQDSVPEDSAHEDSRPEDSSPET